MLLLEVIKCDHSSLFGFFITLSLDVAYFNMASDIASSLMITKATQRSDLYPQKSWHIHVFIQYFGENQSYNYCYLSDWSSDLGACGYSNITGPNVGNILLGENIGVVIYF